MDDVEDGLVDLFLRDLLGLGWSEDKEAAEEDKEERIDIED